MSSADSPAKNKISVPLLGILLALLGILIVIFSAFSWMTSTKTNDDGSTIRLTVTGIGIAETKSNAQPTPQAVQSLVNDFNKLDKEQQQILVSAASANPANDSQPVPASNDAAVMALVAKFRELPASEQAILRKQFNDREGMAIIMNTVMSGGKFPANYTPGMTQIMTGFLKDLTEASQRNNFAAEITKKTSKATTTTTTPAVPTLAISGLKADGQAVAARFFTLSPKEKALLSKAINDASAPLIAPSRLGLVTLIAGLIVVVAGILLALNKIQKISSLIAAFAAVVAAGLGVFAVADPAGATMEDAEKIVGDISGASGPIALTIAAVIALGVAIWSYSIVSHTATTAPETTNA